MKVTFVGKCEKLPEGFSNEFYLGCNVYKSIEKAPNRKNLGYGNYTAFAIEGMLSNKEHCIITWKDKTRAEYVENGNLS